jgi:transposase-like protein
MQMLYPFRGSIQQYIERVGSIEEANRCRPAACPQCKSKEPLVCHGFYKRTVAEIGWDGVIRVRRYLCGACRRTVSLLPEFVLPYL